MPPKFIVFLPFLITVLIARFPGLGRATSRSLVRQLCADFLVILPILFLAIRSTVLYCFALGAFPDTLTFPTNLALHFLARPIYPIHGLLYQEACGCSTLRQAADRMEKNIDEWVLGLVQIGARCEQRSNGASTAVGASVSGFSVTFGLVFRNDRAKFPAE
jgi:hypothetical protein